MDSRDRVRHLRRQGTIFFESPGQVLCMRVLLAKKTEWREFKPSTKRAIGCRGSRLIGIQRSRKEFEQRIAGSAQKSRAEFCELRCKLTRFRRYTCSDAIPKFLRLILNGVFGDRL